MIFTGGAVGGPFEDELWYLKAPGYNSDIADEAMSFFKDYLTHTKGRWKGKPFGVMPWQEHRVIRPLFGILRRQPDDEYPIGLRRYRKAYIEIPKKNGKPLDPATEVMMAGGGWKTLADISVGDCVRLPAGDFADVEEKIDAGVQPRFEVVTRDGRRIIGAPDHPVYTTRGWVEIGELSIGDYLAAANDYEHPQESKITAEEARLMGYFVGDGSCGSRSDGTGLSAGFTNADPEVVADFTKCAELQGWRVRHDRNYNYQLAGGVRDWLRKYGLAGKTSYTKRIPMAVLESNNTILAEFLSTYLDCDGHVAHGNRTSGGNRTGPIVEYYTVSDGLANDVHHALSRLGVRSKLYGKNGKYKGQNHKSLRVTITKISETDKLSRLLTPAGEKGGRLKAFQLSAPSSFGEPHLWADEIKAINELEPGPVVCITVDNIKHCYIANGLVVHNSELLAGIGNKLLLADFEGDPEVSSAACDREQASIIHSVSGDMIRNSDKLSSRCKIIDSRKRIIGYTNDGAPNGAYVALSADVANKHGKNIHGCLFDELHAQPNSDLWDVLTEGSTVAREQPLIFAITTAGWDRESICWKMREHAVRVLTGDIEDDEFLPVIYGMDPEDDWHSEENWKAVNPSMYWMEGDTPSHYGIFNLTDFRKAYQEANELPYKQNTWRRLRLNQWTQQETAFIPMERYDALDAPFTAVELDMLKGRQCYGGVDLSYVNDLTAGCRVFPMDDGVFWFMWDFFIPEAEMQKRIVKDRMPYDVWVRDGWVSPTPGDTIDYNYVEGRWIQHRQDCHINELGFDPYNASQFVNDMQEEGFEMVRVAQTFLSLSPTTKEFLRLILEGRCRFGGNPVARAHANNLMVLEDNHGNIKPTKEKGRTKIDGMIAAICALDCAVRHAGEHGPSVYEDEGVLVL